MIGVLLGGAVVGAGLLLLVRTLVGPTATGAATLARLDADRLRARRTSAMEAEEGRAGERRVVRRVGAVLREVLERRGVRLGRVGADLAVTGTSVETHLATSALAGVLGLVLPAVLGVLAVATGVSVGAVPVLASLVLAVGGLLLPTLVVRSQATEQRRAFRHVVGAFLDLVAMSLAGGRGVPEALATAAAVSDAPAMAAIRRALLDARLQGTTPWHALGRLGADVGVEELVDLGAALALVAEDGAKVKESLSARAESLRRKEIAELEGAAQERSQSMVVAQLLLAAGFLLFLLYPALARITQ
ncbi:type II secretion system F family protein [Pseudokineococcus sp. 1T1Z-3]|uniref:type II secretion system F family protein n=1 Tax=Pseudokineococcus sp. 1T1Z-3 TaxID=3132745 RepID=UPI0030B38A5C